MLFDNFLYTRFYAHLLFSRSLGRISDLARLAVGSSTDSYEDNEAGWGRRV